MLSVFDFFTSAIKKLAALPPSWVLGTLFAVTVSVFFVGFLLGVFIKPFRAKNKNFFYSFSNFTALSALVYTLAESYYVGKTFTLISALLTVSIFYLFSQLKFLLLPANNGVVKNNTVKKIIEKGLNEIKRPYEKQAFLSKPDITSIINENRTKEIKNYAEFDKILEKLQNSEKQTEVDKNKEIIPVIKKDIELNGIKKLTDKLKIKDLTFNDKSEIEKLEKLSDELSVKENFTNEEVGSLNDSLLGLLKMMSKYSV
jgi:hypothetical protein